MTEQFVIQTGREAIFTAFIVAAPVLASGLVVGLAVGILQAVTQIHEMTLTFIPKILAAVLTIIFLLPWMLRTLMEFTTRILTSLPQ